jgi:rubrerythrin
MSDPKDSKQAWDDLVQRIRGAGAAVETYLPSPLRTAVDRSLQFSDLFIPATSHLSRDSVPVFLRLASPTVNHILLQKTKSQDQFIYDIKQPVYLDFRMTNDYPDIDRLYCQAEREQWAIEDASLFNWSTKIDLENHEKALIPEELLPVYGHAVFKKLNRKEKANLCHHFVAWMLSQFYYGEIGAQAIASQLAHMVPWQNAREMADSQAYDEARHVRVFRKYLRETLQFSLGIDPNLAVLLESLVESPEWDIKFLGMQILIEGLALGSFGTLRQVTREPLLKQMLTYVIKDEARHVAFGIKILQKYYHDELTAPERRLREELAAEFAWLMYNRFLGEDLRQQFFPQIKRREWNKIVSSSTMMEKYRQNVFRRIVPDLNKIGLLRDKSRRRYEEMGILKFADDVATDELNDAEIILR